MSGGSMEYLYLKVEDASFSENTPERRALRKHLLQLARVLKEVEWVDSCDSSPGEDSKMITELLGVAAVLDQAVLRAKAAQRDLEQAIAKATASAGSET